MQVPDGSAEPQREPDRHAGGRHRRRRGQAQTQFVPSRPIVNRRNGEREQARPSG